MIESGHESIRFSSWALQAPEDDLKEKKRWNLQE